jgi:hypothetical protein
MPGLLPLKLASPGEADLLRLAATQMLLELF